MKKILITGGAGFIGSNFIHYMLNKYDDYKIVNLDALTYAGNLNNLKSISKNTNYKFIKGDITDSEFVFNLFEKEKFDIVINFAAESHVDRSLSDPTLFLKTNILGTSNLLNASLKFNIERFHQVSTDEVYGQLPLNKPDLLFKEETKLNPSSPYSTSKASADLLVLSYVKTFKLNATISRCSNNYGPYQFPEKLIPLVIYRALNNLDIPVYGNGENIRDWIHVEDHCLAIDLIIHKGKAGEIYNVGSNSEKSNIEVVKLILDYLNKDYSLIKYVDDRLGHDLRYAIDSTKIEKELNFKCRKLYFEGMHETINWYIAKEEWLKEVISKEYLKYYENQYGDK